MTKSKRIFSTSRIGDPAENRLREQGYDLEVFQGPDAPPKSLIIEKVKSGIDALITTLRDPIDEEVFAAGKTHSRSSPKSRWALTTSTEQMPTDTKFHFLIPPMFSPKRRLSLPFS